MAIEGVILDVDGTLVLSNDAHAQAWVEAFSHYGYDIAFDQVRPLIGMGGDQVIPHLEPALNSEEGTGKRIADRRKELILNKFGAELAPTRGTRELVKKLREDGLYLIVASSATEPEMDLLLKVAQVDDLISEFTTSSDAEASKPAPDIVQVALQKANLQPDRTLMLGDTPYDIEAAEKAGVSVIAFRTGGFSDQQLQGAIAIYDDPADLLRQYETSPLATTIPTTANPSTSKSMLPDPSTNELITVSDAATDESVITLPNPATNAPTETETLTFDPPPNSTTNESVEESWRSIQAQTSAFYENAMASLTKFFQNNRQLLTTLGWIFLALLGIRLLLGALDAFDDIPLVTPILKLIGFVYVVRFAWRYLIRKRDRQELVQTLNQAKAEVFGSKS